MAATEYMCEGLCNFKEGDKFKVVLPETKELLYEKVGASHHFVADALWAIRGKTVTIKRDYRQGSLSRFNQFDSGWEPYWVSIGAVEDNERGYGYIFPIDFLGEIEPPKPVEEKPAAMETCSFCKNSKPTNEFAVLHIGDNKKLSLCKSCVKAQQMCLRCQKLFGAVTMYYEPMERTIDNRARWFCNHCVGVRHMCEWCQNSYAYEKLTRSYLNLTKPMWTCAGCADVVGYCEKCRSILKKEDAYTVISGAVYCAGCYWRCEWCRVITPEPLSVRHTDYTTYNVCVDCCKLECFREAEVKEPTPEDASKDTAKFHEGDLVRLIKETYTCAYHKPSSLCECICSNLDEFCGLTLAVEKGEEENYFNLIDSCGRHVRSPDGCLQDFHETELRLAGEGEEHLDTLPSDQVEEDKPEYIVKAETPEDTAASDLLRRPEDVVPLKLVEALVAENVCGLSWENVDKDEETDIPPAKPKFRYNRDTFLRRQRERNGKRSLEREDAIAKAKDTALMLESYFVAKHEQTKVHPKAVNWARVFLALVLLVATLLIARAAYLGM